MRNFLGNEINQLQHAELLQKSTNETQSINFRTSDSCKKTNN